VQLPDARVDVLDALAAGLPPGCRGDRSAERPGRRRCRVNLQTLRYHERRGLLAEPDPSLGGHRLYPAEAVTVLRVSAAR
jgi:hypothetical protein